MAKMDRSFRNIVWCAAVPAALLLSSTAAEALSVECAFVTQTTASGSGLFNTFSINSKNSSPALEPCGSPTSPIGTIQAFEPPQNLAMNFLPVSQNPSLSTGNPDDIHVAELDPNAPSPIAIARINPDLSFGARAFFIAQNGFGDFFRAQLSMAVAIVNDTPNPVATTIDLHTDLGELAIVGADREVQGPVATFDYAVCELPATNGCEPQFLTDPAVLQEHAGLAQTRTGVELKYNVLEGNNDITSTLPPQPFLTLDPNLVGYTFPAFDEALPIVVPGDGSLAYEFNLDVTVLTSLTFADGGIGTGGEAFFGDPVSLSEDGLAPALAFRKAMRADEPAPWSLVGVIGLASLLFRRSRSGSR
jgi:hypothetical protein